VSKINGPLQINGPLHGVSLEEELLDNKLAYEYSGGRKLSWCK